MNTRRPRRYVLIFVKVINIMISSKLGAVDFVLVVYLFYVGSFDSIMSVGSCMVVIAINLDSELLKAYLSLS